MMTKQQHSLVRELETADRVLVRAIAGGGKSLMTLKLASGHMDAQEKLRGGLPVLVIVHTELMQRHYLLQLRKQFRSQSGSKLPLRHNSGVVL